MSSGSLPPVSPERIVLPRQDGPFGQMRQAALVVSIGLLAAGVVWLSTGGWDAWVHRDRGPGKEAPYTLAITRGTLSEKEIAFYQKKVAENPGGFMDLNGLAGCYLKMARSSADPSWYLLAEQAARRSLKNFPTDNVGAELILVRVLIARHRFPEALATAQALRQRHSSNPSIYGSLVTINVALGDLPMAFKAAYALAVTFPSLETYTQLGLVYEAQGFPEEAEKAFRQGMGLEQTGEQDGSANARTWLGRVKLKQGKLDAAEDLFHEALRIRNDHPVALVLLGDLECKLSRWSDAQHHYATAFERYQNAMAQWKRGTVEIDHGSTAQGQAWQAEAVAQLRRELANGDVGHRRDLAQILLERGETADRVEALTLMRGESSLRHDAETRKLLKAARAANGQPTP